MNHIFLDFMMFVVIVSFFKFVNFGVISVSLNKYLLLYWLYIFISFVSFFLFKETTASTLEGVSQYGIVKSEKWYVDVYEQVEENNGHKRKQKGWNNIILSKF